MVRDPLADADDPDLEAVLDALHDDRCRVIIQQLTEPRTAGELTEVADIPSSTAYRKLEQLTEATLLEEGVELRADGSHASRYEVAFREVVIGLDDDNRFTLEIERPPRRSDERLAELWSEVRREV